MNEIQLLMKKGKWENAWNACCDFFLFNYEIYHLKAVIGWHLKKWKEGQQSALKAYEMKKLSIDYSIYDRYVNHLIGMKLYDQIEELFPKMKTIVINLKKRPDRYERIVNQVQGLPLQLERFEAFDGHEVDMENETMKHLFRKDPSFVKRSPYNVPLPKGAIGCTLSHLEIWKTIANGNENVLILEDDAVFDKEFRRKFFIVQQLLSENNWWNVCHLGSHDDQPIYDDPILTKMDDMEIKLWNPFPPRRHGGGLFGYIVSPLGAKRLLEKSKQYGMSLAVDWFIVEVMKDLVMFKTYPHIITSKLAHESNDSNIQNVN